jgi:hypothetical protein
MGPDLSGPGFCRLSGCSENCCVYRGPYGCATVMRNLLYQEATEFTCLGNTQDITHPNKLHHTLVES